MKKISREFLFLICYFFALSPIAHAQEPIEFQKADSLTLALYNEARWHDLIVEGTKAIDAGIDHYYMQMRVGIAFYESENYRKAIQYFEAARQVNPLSKTVIEYLYYSYTLSGRDNDAGRIAYALSEEQKNKIGINLKNPVELVYMETGPGIGLNDDLKNYWADRMENSDSIYSKTYLYNQLYYTHVGMKFRLHSSITTYQGYNNVRAGFSEKVNSMGTEWPDYKGNISQHEYYGNLAIAIPSGISVTAAWHLLWVDFQNQIDFYDSTMYVLSADTIKTVEEEALFSLAARKDFGLFAIQGMASFGDFVRTKTSQAGLLFYIFPLGNLDLYSETGIFSIWNQRDRSDFIFHQMVGVKLLPVLWLEAEATIGNLKDYNERMSFTVYNTADKINYKIEGNIIYDISNRLEFSLRGRYMERNTNYWYNTDLSTTEELEKTFGYITLIGGLKWKF